MQLALCLAMTLVAWDRQKAFDYLETRGQRWAEWKPAQKPQGACVSCHTGLSYLMLRRVLAEAEPRPVERDLVRGVKLRMVAEPPQTMLGNEGAEAILNLLTLALQRRNRKDPVAAVDALAMKRLWEKQTETGAWKWFMHNLHPVESDHSHFFAATLADYALSAYATTQPAENVSALKGYLQREFAGQPLHNKMAWLAFSAPKGGGTKVLAQLWAAQSADGGWTSAALGPWSAQPKAPVDEGSNAYATAWAAYTAREAGVSCQEPGLRKALVWLQQHQDRATGAWLAVSMNKVYPAGSMQEKFMTDAATGYAAAALIGCKIE